MHGQKNIKIIFLPSFPAFALTGQVKPKDNCQNSRRHSTNSLCTMTVCLYHRVTPANCLPNEH